MIVLDETMLRHYINAAVDVSPKRPILIDKFLENAIEVETDAIADGEEVFVPAIMQHIEYAGIHSGDSSCAIPPVSIKEEHMETIERYTKLIANKLHVKGLMNIQYAISNGTVYILEANPRASRTVPLVSKVCNIPMVKIATGIMLGKTLKGFNLKHNSIRHFGVKSAVFPFNMFPEVDPVLGPEMRSTGEVLGMAESFGLAFFKAQEAAGMTLPTEGAILITVADCDKEAMLPVAERFQALGFKIFSTQGTRDFLARHGVDAELALKIYEGRPNIVDALKNKDFQLIVNTPMGKLSEIDDSFIRKSAIKYKIPYLTTITAAMAATYGILAWKEGHSEVKSLQAYHREIAEK
jgi:carbamoyl-phosphate synthase large subunit